MSGTFQWQSNLNITSNCLSSYSFMKTLPASGIIAAVVCLAATPVSAQPNSLANGLDGYWTFDETSGGILHDSSGHGFNGNLINFPGGQGNWTSGEFGGALQFGGPSSGQSVSVANFAMPTSSMTLTAWVWANSLPRWATVAANWNGGWGAFNYATFGGTPNMSLYVADAHVQGGINIDYGYSSASLSLNQWHFLAFVANSANGTVTFMQDGVVVGGLGYAGDVGRRRGPDLSHDADWDDGGLRGRVVFESLGNVCGEFRAGTFHADSGRGRLLRLVGVDGGPPEPRRHTLKAQRLRRIFSKEDGRWTRGMVPRCALPQAICYFPSSISPGVARHPFRLAFGWFGLLRFAGSNSDKSRAGSDKPLTRHRECRHRERADRPADQIKSKPI